MLSTNESFFWPAALLANQKFLFSHRVALRMENTRQKLHVSAERRLNIKTLALFARERERERVSI